MRSVCQTCRIFVLILARDISFRHRVCPARLLIAPSVKIKIAIGFSERPIFVRGGGREGEIRGAGAMIAKYNGNRMNIFNGVAIM